MISNKVLYFGFAGLSKVTFECKETFDLTATGGSRKGKDSIVTARYVTSFIIHITHRFTMNYTVTVRYNEEN